MTRCKFKKKVRKDIQNVISIGKHKGEQKKWRKISVKTNDNNRNSKEIDGMLPLMIEAIGVMKKIDHISLVSYSRQLFAEMLWLIIEIEEIEKPLKHIPLSYWCSTVG